MKRRDALASESDGESRTLEVVLDTACPYTPVLAIFFSIALLFVLFSTLVIATQPPGSGAFVVSLMTVVIDGFVMAVTGSLLYLCRKHRFG